MKVYLTTSVRAENEKRHTLNARVLRVCVGLCSHVSRAAFCSRQSTMPPRGKVHPVSSRHSGSVRIWAISSPGRAAVRVCNRLSRGRARQSAGGLRWRVSQEEALAARLRLPMGALLAAAGGAPAQAGRRPGSPQRGAASLQSTDSLPCPAAYLRLLGAEARERETEPPPSETAPGHRTEELPGLEGPAGSPAS